MAATSVSTALVADDALLRASFAGDDGAFEELFLRHYARVHAIAIRIAGSHEDAEEIALDVFLQLHQRKLDPERGANVAGWLYRATTNAAFNRVRSRNRRRAWWWRLARRDGSPGMAEDPAEVVQRRDAAEAVRQALAGLPERQRDAVVLRASGLAYAEIADAIGVQPSSVGTLIARGERKLREIMSNESEG